MWYVAARCFLAFFLASYLIGLDFRAEGSFGETQGHSHKVAHYDRRPCSLAVARAVALPQGIVTVTRLRELTIRTDAGLRVHAPKQTVVARRHGRVALGVDEESLPTERGAQSRMAGIKP